MLNVSIGSTEVGVRLKVLYSDGFYPFFTTWVKWLDLQKVLGEFADRIRGEDNGIYGIVQTVSVKGC